MHVYEDRDAVTLVSGYIPGQAKTHLDDLRDGVESKGRLISSQKDRLAVEMFLLNGDFGTQPGEVLLIRVAEDGRSRMEARAVGGVVRTIDTGTCTWPDGAHS